MLQRRVIFSFLRCALPLWLGLQGAAAWAAPASLAELEEGARTGAPAVRLAQAELELAMQRTGAVRASQGARLFGGASLGSAREAVTDTLSRDYQRAQMQLGVRWPLLGSREAQLRNTSAAELTVLQAQVRLHQAQREAVQAVRRAAVRQMRSTERQQIAHAFLQAQPQALAQLRQRQQAGVLLEADRLDLLGLFNTVQAAHASQAALQESVKRELARLTDQPLSTAPLPAQALAWPEACSHADALLAQVDEAPAVLLARLEMDASTRMAGHARREGIEAGVSIAQGVSRDFGGPSGRNTTLGVDFSMPLQWRAQRDAALGQIQSEHHRAESLLQLRRSEFEAAVEQALAQWRLRRDEMPGHLHRLRAAHEAMRVALLRIDAFDGDGYSRLLMARHALYQAAVQVVDGTERRELAGLELLALGPAECAPTGLAAQDEAATALAPAVAALAALPALGPSAKPAQARAAEAAGLGWYVWNGQALLEQPTRLDALPPGSSRVLLSFTAVQLQALAQPAGRAQLLGLLARAHGQGLRVELLLGEPTWVLPARRPALLALLAPLRALPFDGLNLDLERSQLPPAEQPLWDAAVIDTVRAVHGAIAWPLALTTHYRELQAPGFARRVHAAGAAELVAMVYVSNPVRAADIARPLLQGPAGLRLAVAQSMERSLSQQESSHGAGQAAALRRWHRLMQSLAQQPAFSGIVVQSLEEFKEARP